jgi:hypothetical protein
VRRADGGVDVAMHRRSVLAAVAVACGLAAPCRAQGGSEASAAEKALFAEPHLRSLRAPQRLRYRFEHRPAAASAARAASAAPATPFDDTVTLHLSAAAGAACCAVRGQFLSGARELRLPELDDAQSNPVTLYFLEREVRELQRLTGGQAAHFRRRIRTALAEAPAPQATTFRHRGRDVAGTHIEITPFAGDPQRHRFEKQATMRYRFVLSPEVPGTIWRIEAELPGVHTDTLTLLETS